MKLNQLKHIDMEIVRAENVVKKFGHTTATDRVSFAAKSGRILGLLGPNGAGKTTMIRMINNIYVPDEGNITIFGEALKALHQNRMGYLPEERGLYKKVKVIDQLTYFGMLKGLSRSTAIEAASKWLHKLDAADWAPKKIQELSKGMAQKVQFISTIMHNPDLIILDEPFSGFDPINQELFKKLILDLRREGVTIILSTHVMEQAEQLCDDIVLINRGKTVLSGSLREIKRNHGRDTVIIEYEGSDEFLGKFSGLRFSARTEGRVEFRIDDPNLKPKAILEEAMKCADIVKFELVEPSLHEIFIKTVTKQEPKNEH